MDRMTFLKTLADRGYSRDEATQALTTWRNSGKTFDDDQPEQTTTEQPQTNWVPGGAGGVVTRALTGGLNIGKNLLQFATGADLSGQNRPWPVAGSLESTIKDVNNFATTPGTSGQELLGVAKGIGSTLGNLPGIIGNTVGVVSPAAGQAINNWITPGESQYIYQPKNAEQEQGSQLGGEVTNLGLMAEVPGEGIIAKSANQVLNVANAPGNVIGSAVRIPDVIAGKLASSLSGVPEETLRAVTNRAKAQQVAANAGKEYEIGQSIVDHLNDAYNQVPKAVEIESHLEDLNPINVNTLTEPLLEKAASYKTPEMQAIGDKLVTQAESLTKMADENGNIAPKDLWDYRKQLDQTLYGANTGELGTGAYIEGLKGLRDDIKSSLENSAEGTPYSDLMQDASNKLSTIDDMKKLLGGTEYKQSVNAESFVKNIMNANKTQQQSFLKNFQDVFETPDYIQAATDAKMARQLGESKGSGPEWLSMHQTGKAGLGPMLDIATSGKPYMSALSSPYISTRYTLPITQNLGNLGVPITKATQAGYVNQLNPLMLGNINQEQQ